MVEARKKLSDARKAHTIGRDSAQTAAQKVISAAHMKTYAQSFRNTMSLHREIEYISG